MIANVTSEMKKETDRMRQEIATELQSGVQLIAIEVQEIKKYINEELTSSA
jgi:hypothetical protein